MIPGWLEMLSDKQRVAAVARSPECAGMTPQQVADYINEPRRVGTTVRILNTGEVYDALSQETKAKLSAASEDYQVATSAPEKQKAAAGGAFYDRCWCPDGLKLSPGGKGLAELDTAIAAGYVTASDKAALLVLATVPTMICLRTVELADGGLGWSEHRASEAEVVEAIGGTG